jgi:hypothetical protein
VVVIAAGIAAAGGFTSAPEAPPPRAVDVAHVVCQPLGTVVRTPRVNAERDGVHLAVTNLSKAELLEIRSASDDLLAEAPIEPDGVTENVFTIPPGDVTVTCLSGRLEGRDRSAAVLDVLDTAPWISPTLACGDDVDLVELTAEEIPDEPAAATAGRTVPGLRSSDTLAKPGYPNSRWHGDLLVVLREGETVGRITRAEDRGAWSVVVTACRDSGLTDV